MRGSPHEASWVQVRTVQEEGGGRRGGGSVTQQGPCYPHAPTSEKVAVGAPDRSQKEPHVCTALRPGTPLPTGQGDKFFYFCTRAAQRGFEQAGPRTGSW